MFAHFESNYLKLETTRKRNLANLAKREAQAEKSAFQVTGARPSAVAAKRSS